MAIQHTEQIRLTVIHRGNKYPLHASIHSTLSQLGEELQRLTTVVPRTMRLLIPQNRRTSFSSLVPFSDEHAAITLQASGLTEDIVLRMMGSLPEELKEVVVEKEDRSIIGFSEEDRRAKQHSAPNYAMSWKLPEGIHKFGKFKPLELPGIELDPPPDKALEIMHRLASDPGIVSIMNKHQWRVGLMTEMAPLGYVGITPKCVLGVNKNQGEEISLRLRTDDLKGFRKYESIKKTLLHELAHMVYSEHDTNFFALDKQLNEESIALDWTKAKGHKWGGLNIYEENHHSGISGMQSDSISRVYKVGGTAQTFEPNAQSAAAAAALRRLEKAPIYQAEHGIGEVMTREQLQNTSSDLLCSTTQHDMNNLAAAEHCKKKGVGSGSAKNDTFKTNKSSNNVTLASNSEQTQDDHSDHLTAHVSEGSLNCNPDADEAMEEASGPGIPSGIQSIAYQAARSGDTNRFPVTHDGGDSHWSGDLDLRMRHEPSEIVCRHLRQAVAKLKEEASPSEASLALHTLFTILRNVIEFPQEAKFKRLKKANPLFQSRVANFKGALEVLHTVGFSEQPNELGIDGWLILERYDPGLLWLVRSFLETCMA